MTEPITAEPLCRAKTCPEPSNPDFHVCPCGAQNVEHHHIESRARAPGKKHSKANIMMLCTEHHRMVSLNLVGAVVLPIEGVGRFWQLLDLHGNMLFQRLVEPREEARSAPRQGSGQALMPPPRLDSVYIDAKQRLDAEEAFELAVVEPRQAPAPWDEWIGKVQTLANAIAVMPWAIGDLINEGEERFGEMAWQYLDTLGMDHARLSNYAWISKAFPPTTRVMEGLRWSHYREVAALPEPEREAKLREALEQNMSTRELHVAIKGEPEPILRRCPSCGYIGPLAGFPKEER